MNKVKDLFLKELVENTDDPFLNIVIGVEFVLKLFFWMTVATIIYGWFIL